MHKKMVKQAVILAGGRGKRLRPFTDKHPKPLYPIDGIPFIKRLVEQIKSFGIRRIVLLVGYMAEQIIETLDDGKEAGVEISYDILPAEFDTGDRLLHAEELLDDYFLLMYCDNYCPINFTVLEEDFFKNQALIQLSVYSNKDNYTRNNILLSRESQRIEVYDKSRQAADLLGVDIGYAIVSKKILQMLVNPVGNFACALYGVLAKKGKLYATVTEHRYYSIGSYERLALTKEFFKDKRAAFIDRDGTLNIRPPKACYIEKPENFIWLPGAIKAVKMLNDAGYLTILFTNQPGVARGNLTMEDLNAIHEKMNRELAEEKAHIDYIYCCVHDWNEGCDCRKPKPGLLYQAQRDLSLNLMNAVVFGDDERDMEAGRSADCKTVRITDEYPLLTAVKEYLT